VDFSSDTLTFSIGASIGDTIIGDTFFRHDEVLAKMAAKRPSRRSTR
jgi:hypothetical protein